MSRHGATYTGWRKVFHEAMSPPMWVLLLLASLQLLPMAACTSNPITNAHETAVHLVINGEGSCSGTIIGPHAVLSATHCFEWPYTVRIYGQPVRFLRAVLDGNDHTILIVDRTFTTWA